MLKPGGEEQHLANIRLFATGKNGRGTLREESGLSLISSSRRGGIRSEDDVSTGAVLELSEIKQWPATFF